MQHLTFNLRPRYRKATFNGEEHLVVPLRMIVPGVLNGSKGPLYYPPEEIAANYQQWDGIPVTLYHPTTSDGRGQSAKAPGVLARSGMGVIRNPRVDNRGLRAEAWLHVAKTKKLSPHVYNAVINNKPVEISTGLFTDNFRANNGANYKGRSYGHIARNYRADHLAILPGQVGACSVNDGCGLLVNGLRKTSLGLGNPTQNGWVTTDSGTHIFIGEGGEVTKGPAALKGKGDSHAEKAEEHLKTAEKHLKRLEKVPAKLDKIREKHEKNKAAIDKKYADRKAKREASYKTQLGSGKSDKTPKSQLGLGGAKSASKPAPKQMTEFEKPKSEAERVGHSLGKLAGQVSKKVSDLKSSVKSGSLWDKFKKFVGGPHGLGFNMTENQEQLLFQRFQQFLELTGNSELLENSKQSDFMECEEDCDDEDCVDDCLDELQGNSSVSNGGPGSGPHKGGGSDYNHNAPDKAGKFKETWVTSVSGQRSSGMGTIRTSYHVVKGETPDGKIKTISKHDTPEAAQQSHADLTGQSKPTKNQEKCQESGKFLSLGAGNGKGEVHQAAKQGHSTLKGDIVAPEPDKEEIMEVRNGGPGSGPQKGGGSKDRSLGSKPTKKFGPGSAIVAHQHSNRAMNASNIAASTNSKRDHAIAAKAHSQAAEAYRAAASKASSDRKSSFLKRAEDHERDAQLHSENKHSQYQARMKSSPKIGSKEWIASLAKNEEFKLNRRSGDPSVRNKESQKMAKLTEEDREGIISNLCTNCDCQKANVFNEDDREMLENMDDTKLVALAEQRDQLAANEMVVNSVRKTFPKLGKLALNAMPAALAKAQGRRAAPVVEGSAEEEEGEGTEQEQEGQEEMVPAKNQLSGDDAAVLNWARQERDAQKKEIIELMVENLDDEQAQVTANELNKLSLEQLKVISPIAPRRQSVQNTQFPLRRQQQSHGQPITRGYARPPQFLGAAGGPINNRIASAQRQQEVVDNSGEDILDIPSLNCAELSPLHKKNNGSN